MYIVTFNNKEYSFKSERKKVYIAKENLGSIIDLLIQNQYIIIEICEDIQLDTGINIIRKLKKQQKPEDMEFGNSR